MSPMRGTPVVNAVIQARLSSTRLPGKVLRPLAGRSVLGWVVRAAAAARGVDQVVVATSDAADDDAVAEEAARLGALVARGPLDDVLARFAIACELHPADAVIRLTADCPLLDPALIGQLATLWRAQPSLDYVSTTLVRTLPRGFDAELVRTAVLAEQVATATGTHREHVTSGIYSRPETYSCAGIVVSPAAEDLRVTLDTPEDWQVIEGVVEDLGDRVSSWREVVSLLRARPDLTALNAHVEQKKVAR
ncbi:cytidylyltransferase domain-containing protein [Amycolatopsis sp. H20-H5]|uniref:cytidylyltransferase domain-containing protein n=1 Tax=Amycolatopsis sp. H20-H5 TaxID=3046309 RepID=UPI002DBA5702|nr:NTP transferase domain-containing protein [Amycolatopsis sp. H20-H5]MEC3975700.1 NTP transferase domain-containing protein [Amycolatopsis sp. H20-H5]